MHCCGYSGADVVILITLFMVTMYSAYSYYTYLFPHTLKALELAFLQPFGLEVVRPTSSFPLHLSHLFNVSPKNWILFGISVFLLILATWAYVMAVVTDPGRVPQAFRQRSPKSLLLAREIAGAPHLCPLCIVYKPQRAHHCSHCGRCVLKYDHHCPWLGQCVGFFNYKLYLLVVLYTFVFTLWVSTLLLIAIFVHLVQHYELIGGIMIHRNPQDAVWRNGKCQLGPFLLAGDTHSTTTTTTTTTMNQQDKGNTVNTPKLLLGGMDGCPPFLGVYVCLGESLIFLLLTASLLIKHWKLARHNLTTLDLVIQQHQLEQGVCTVPPPNPFDLGVKENLHQVFGDGDEHGEHMYPNFILRWVFRLLPFSAYPKQKELRLDLLLNDNNSGSPSNMKGLSAVSVANYGTLKRSDSDVNPSSETSSLSDLRHHSLQLTRNYRGQLLGLAFPTISSPMESTIV
ncbi:palmitoyltransferase PFA3 [Trypanosoma theileri]|uniref:Palmitoyltransferase n=1 Tax=Trypanosoma theileri TaxID=67003 RepID=A0A1X0P0I7_9TRYP|nr:palmitoyltransferase PFA3 [Trypanosoma theileri]ORC90466.1 palmitoyltransferase PFA3 [Trypanosoma theileri]